MRLSEILKPEEIDLIKDACNFIRRHGINIQRIEVGDKVVRPMRFFKNGKEVIENVIYFNPPKERKNEQ